jgi:hypothetical protein
MRRQNTAGAAGARRFREANRPPQDAGGFFWFTSDMLNSPSWLAMPFNARRVVEGIASEHMAQGGTRNGELIVTYENLIARGIRRQAIPPAINIAEALGWIDVTFRGGMAYGAARCPSTYGLTWLPRSDERAATNRWKAIKTDEQARATVRAASKPRAAPRLKSNRRAA